MKGESRVCELLRAPHALMYTMMSKGGREESDTVSGECETSRYLLSRGATN